MANPIQTDYLGFPNLWVAYRINPHLTAEVIHLKGTGSTEKAAVIDLLEKELAEQGIKELSNAR